MKPQNPHTENKDKHTSDFKFIWLGQTICTYQVPFDIFEALNLIYETEFHNLPNAGKQLAGKIVNEHSLFYGGEKTKKMNPHNKLPPYLLDWFIDRFQHYLDFNRISPYKLNLNSVWVNEMRAGEYNPIHIHQGTTYTGLSSVMVLKLPNDMGPEISRPDQPMNGKLQILGNTAGQFVKSDFGPDLEERQFYVFPYDLRQCVYPHSNPKVVRRTLAANCDVEYNPVNTRTAQ